MTILLTGGLGKTSRRITSVLNTLSPSTPILNTSRTPSPSSSSSTALFNWSDPTTIASLFTHPSLLSSPITSIYLVISTDANPVPLVSTLITTAISHLPPSTPLTVVFLSSDTILPSATSPVPHGLIHQYLLDFSAQNPGKLHYAILQPAFFMQNFTESGHRNTIVEQGKIYSATGDGKEPFVSAEDIADVAARCLLGEAGLDREYLIRGPKRISYDEVAEIVGRVTGKKVEHVGLTTQQLTDVYVGLGMPEVYAERLAGLDEGIREGKGGEPVKTMEEVVGRKAISFEEFAEKEKAAWI